MAQRHGSRIPGDFRRQRHGVWLAAVLCCLLGLLCLPGPAPVAATPPNLADSVKPLDSADHAVADPPGLFADSPLRPFWHDARVSGGLYFFGRDRRRYDVERKTYRTNLRHGSLQANLDLVSGYAWDHLGFDFGVFTSHDLFNYGAPDHEMGFEPWRDP